MYLTSLSLVTLVFPFRILKCLESQPSFSFTFDVEQNLKKKTEKFHISMRNVMTFGICSEYTNLQEYVDVMVTLLSHPGTERKKKNANMLK